MTKFLLCSSSGSGKHELTSFDDALKNSDIANYNLVKVSSILPAMAKRNKVIDIAEGNILYTAFALKTSNEVGEIMSAAIAVGIPKDKAKVGVIMEYAGNCKKEDAIKQVHEMVQEAMISRDYEIEEILSTAQEIQSDGNGYKTAFAALAMW